MRDWTSWAETELLLFENYPLSSSILSSKNNRRYSKKCKKNKQIRLFKRDYMINGNKNEAENEKNITQIWHK